MLSISNGPRGYTLKFSDRGSGARGWKVEARDIEEVHEAIDHHFAGRSHTGSRPTTCPICRDCDKKENRRGKR